MLAMRQAGQGIAMRLLAQLLHLRGLLVEQVLQARDHHVHGLAQAGQFRHARLLHGDEAPLHQRLGLPHRRVQRPADAAHPERRQHTGQAAQHGQPHRGLQAAFPELIVGEARVARHLHRAQRTPAIGDLSHAHRRVDGHHAHEPGGGLAMARTRVGLVVVDHAPGRILELDLLV